MIGAPEYPDCFIVINGPEDGTQFPIARAPFNMGQDPSCAVNIRLDTTVRPIHARATLVSDGYRIRSKDDVSVYVNGKPAGTIRSRIVRSGGVVQLGHTMLVLDCAPDGLASRSHGIDTASDFVWAAREGARQLARLARAALRVALRIAARLLSSWLGVLAALILLYTFWPWFHAWVNYLVQSAYYHLIQSLIRRIFG